MGRGGDEAVVTEAPRRKSSNSALIRLSGEYQYLNPDNSTHLNWFADQIKYNEGASISTDGGQRETAWQASRGVISACGGDAVEEFMREYAAMTKLPVHEVSLSTGGAHGTPRVQMGGRDLEEEDLLRAVQNPGIFLIRESDIPRDADDPQWSAERRNLLRRRLVEAKHGDALVLLIKDWQHAGNIEEGFSRSQAIDIEAASSEEAEHIINEVHRLVAREEYSSNPPKDIDGIKISEERAGIHRDSMPESDVETIDASPLKDSPLPIGQIMGRVDREGTFVIVARPSKREREEIVRRKHPEARIVFLDTSPDNHHGKVHWILQG